MDRPEPSREPDTITLTMHAYMQMLGKLVRFYNKQLEVGKIVHVRRKKYLILRLCGMYIVWLQDMESNKILIVNRDDLISDLIDDMGGYVE